MFEIHIQNSDVTSGSIPISWCTDDQTLEELKNLGLEDPQVVIIVAPVEYYSERKESRKVVSLKDMMTWIEFDRPGPHKIFAFISNKFSSLSQTRKIVRETRKFFLQKNASCGFSADLLNYDGDDYSERINDAPKSCPILVNVPKEIFAQVPEWEKKWVEYLFFNPSSNQCQYRRRRIFSYAFQPIIFLFLYLISLVIIAVSAFMGFRSTSLKPLFNFPIEALAKSSDLIENPNGTVFISQDKTGWRKWIFFPLHPAMLLIEFLIFFLLTLLFVKAKFIFSLLFILVLACCAFVLYSKFADKIIDFFDTKTTKHFWYEEDKEVIICNNKPKPVVIDALPSKFRTMKLRYQDLKSKICKPFSR